MTHVQNTDVEWQPVSTAAQFNCDPKLAVLDSQGVHALVFRCRRVLEGWIKAETKEWIDIQPTHWSKWTE
jgi:hypothetical protein